MANLMGTTSNEIKQHWNAMNYTQVKVSVPPDVASAFKAKCMEKGVSMTSEILRFMGEQENSVKKTFTYAYTTRQQRRRAVKILMEQIEKIMDAEQQYKENIPSNLEGSCLYEAAEQAVSAFEEALDILNEAY